MTSPRRKPKLVLKRQSVEEHAGRRLLSYEVYDEAGKLVGFLSRHLSESWRRTSSGIRYGFRGHYAWWSVTAVTPAGLKYAQHRPEKRADALAWIQEKLQEARAPERSRRKP